MPTEPHITVTNTGFLQCSNNGSFTVQSQVTEPDLVINAWRGSESSGQSFSAVNYADINGTRFVGDPVYGNINGARGHPVFRDRLFIHFDSATPQGTDSYIHNAVTRTNAFNNDIDNTYLLYAYNNDKNIDVNIPQISFRVNRPVTVYLEFWQHEDVGAVHPTTGWVTEANGWSTQTSEQYAQARFHMYYNGVYQSSNEIEYTYSNNAYPYWRDRADKYDSLSGFPSNYFNSVGYGYTWAKQFTENETNGSAHTLYGNDGDGTGSYLVFVTPQ